MAMFNGNTKILIHACIFFTNQAGIVKLIIFLLNSVVGKIIYNYFKKIKNIDSLQPELEFY